MPQRQEAPRPPALENGRPMVRPAPPVQERPDRQQSEERKFQTWQQQRPSAPESRPAPKPQERAPQPQHRDNSPHRDDTPHR